MSIIENSINIENINNLLANKWHKLFLFFVISSKC